MPRALSMHNGCRVPLAHCAFPAMKRSSCFSSEFSGHVRWAPVSSVALGAKNVAHADLDA